MLFNFPIFGGISTRGVLSRMKAILDTHSIVLGNVEGEDGILVRKNWKGGITIGVQSEYKSKYVGYFALYDASELDQNGVPTNCKIGVTDSGWLATGDPPSEPDYCGVVKLNGESVNVDVAEEAVSADGAYSVWLHMWLDAAEGAKAEIVVGAVDDHEKPDNPNGGLIWASHLLGRFAVLTTNSVRYITDISQYYMAGSEHSELLYGDCDGTIIDCPECP